MKKRSVKIPIFTGRLVIYMIDTKEEYNKFCKDNVDGYTYKDGILYYVVCIHDKSLLSTLVHESVHITNYIFKQHGLKLDVNNDEAQAYITTWVFEQIHKLYKQ